MTKTRQAYLDRKSKESIADKDRAMNERRYDKDREVDKEVKMYSAKESAKSQRIGAYAGAAGRVVGSAIGAIVKKNPIELYTYGSSEQSGLVAHLPTDFNYAYRFLRGVPNYYDFGESFVQVFTMPYINLLGEQNTVHSSSAVNISAVNQQALLRQANSRIGEYEPGDLLQVQLASLDVFENIMLAKRMLACYNVQNTINGNLRKELIMAHGADVASVEDHIKDLRAKLNLLIADFNTNIKLPRAFALAVRREILASYMIIDGTPANRQIFVPLKQYGVIYDEQNAELTPISWVGTAILSVIEQQLQVLKESSTLVTMYADIEGAVGADNLYHIEPLDKNELPQFVLSSDIGDQIRNADLLHVSSVNASSAADIANLVRVQQDSDGWLFTSALDTSANYTFKVKYNDSTSATVAQGLDNNAYLCLHNTDSGGSTVLNVDDETLKSPVLIEPFLFKLRYAICSIESSEPEYVYHHFKTVGTEIILGICPISFNALKSASPAYYSLFYMWGHYRQVLPTGVTSGVTMRWMAGAAIVDSFGYAPIKYHRNLNGGSTALPWTNWHNPVVVPYQQLDMISKMVCLSLFNITTYTTKYRK